MGRYNPPMPRPARPILLLILALLLALPLLMTGCVRRTITITSTPPGALVWLNDREVGRTPLEVDFLFYGNYDVRLVKDGYEPLITSGNAKAPIWDWAGIDLVAEMLPLDFQSNVKWDYVLEPVIVDEAGMIQRARELRSRLREAAAEDSEGEK